jgi:hypothetical protein
LLSTGIEKEGLFRVDNRQHHVTLDRIPSFETDAFQRTLQRSRNGVTLAYARLAIFGDCILKVATDYACHIDGDRLWAQAEEQYRHGECC